LANLFLMTDQICETGSTLIKTTSIEEELEKAFNEISENDMEHEYDSDDVSEIRNSVSAVSPNTLDFHEICLNLRNEIMSLDRIPISTNQWVKSTNSLKRYRSWVAQ